MQSHVNTFNKGMTKDYNVLYQPDGTYRHCVNCSLLSQDGNNYVIKDCLGNVRTFVINIRYGGTSTTFDLPPMPIGFISFPDKLVVFSTNSESEAGGYGEIGLINYQPYGEGVAPVIVAGNNNDGYVPLYHSSDLKFTKLQQIEGFAFQENDDIQRVYWTDDLNEPRVIDIGNPIYTTYIASGGLITGTQYMVLEGVITHNGVQYGPSVAGTIVGNVFTAVNANYTSVTGTSPTPKVIRYVAYQLLSFTPSRSLGNIYFGQYGTGSLYCGNKMYFYRLGNPTEGIYTSWSYGSFPVPVRLGDSNDYFNDVGGGTPTSLVNSGKSVVLVVNNIDLNFQRIQIAVAEFDQLVDVPRNLAIILDEAITSASMQFEHSSNINLGTLTLNELTLFPASILTCKTMTTNKNYILIGNITERGEFAFDKSSVTIEQFDYPIPAHRDNNWAAGPSCSNVMTYVPLDYDPFNNPTGANAIPPYSHWLVTNDSNGPVFYNGNNYNAGDVFVGVPGVFTVTIPLGSTIGPCASRNKYTTTGGTPRPDALLLSSGYWDYKDPTVAHHVKGIWEGDKYRYGILFYDLKGNPFYVRHLADIETAYGNSVPFLGNGGPTLIEADNDGNVLYTLQTGVRFSGITISPEIAAQISGFSIVRAERDPKILTQGLLFQTTDSYATVSGYTVIQPASVHKLSKDNSPGSRAKFYSFICPDNLVDFPITNFGDGISDGSLSIEEAYWVGPRDQAQNQLGDAGYLKSVTPASNEFETKYFDTLGYAGAEPQTEVIKSKFDVAEKANLAQFSNTTIYYQNVTDTGNAVNIDTQCFTTTPNTTNTLPLNTVGVGGLRAILELTDDTLLDYNVATTYASIPNSGVRKMMVNIINTKTNQYGGNSESALSTTNYISTGHFQPITPAVLADTLSGGNYVFNDVEVFGGDCFTQLVDYGYALYDDAAVKPIDGSPTGSYSWGIKFPCQSNANYALRTGVPKRKIAPDFMHSNPTPGNGIYYKLGTSSQLEGFQYNQGYSSDGNFVAYPALPLNYSTSNTFRYRIRFGGEKFPGELINSFRTFLINDRKDTDGHGGEINNLRTKDGRTFVWQNSAIDLIPILERQLISGLDGAETSLGTGGVVERFDPVTSYYGNQHQWGLTATEYGWAWFDMRRKAVVTLSLGEGVSEISKVEGLEGFFNEAFLEVIGNTSAISNNLLNDPMFTKYSDRPLIGVGICGVYDPKFKMTYLTFKFIQRGVTVKYNKDFTIGYSHTDKQFIGFYDKTPAISWNHNQIVIHANNPKNKVKYYGTGMNGTLFEVGNVVPYLNAEYICIAEVDIASYPGVGDEVPGYPGSIYWDKINQTNELWVDNQPRLLGQAVAPDYLYNSVFGQVINNLLQFVVNPRSQNPFSVLNIEQEGNMENITDLYIEAEEQTAQDVNIRSTSRFYRKIYDKITSNLPFSGTGRITNSYLLMTFRKKNWQSDPRVVSRGVKILRLVTSFFESKR